MPHYLRTSARPSGLGKDIPQSSSDDRPGRVFETAKLEQIWKGAKGARVWGRSLQYNIGRAPRNRGIYPSFSGIPRRGFAASAIPLRLRRSLPSKQKKAFGASSKAVFVLWRRRRDSNPRSSYPDTAFRVRPDRPLRHFSINCRTKVILFYVGCSLFASFFLRVKLRIGSTK
jgi:hypothetical protein